MLNPAVHDPDFTLYVGDALETLRGLDDGSVDCCVTSPPYWGLRDYGTDGQLGLEATPDEYVAGMVAVFREVRRVLADTGTCWVNLGDSYASGPRGNAPDDWSSSGLAGAQTSARYRETLAAGTAQTRDKTKIPGLKPKDLVGIPWRVAFALQQDGWYLRSDIIWAKPNPMPESVTDRPTKAHEYVFLLSKQPRYWFDADAVREPHSPDGRLKTVHDHATPNSHPNYDNVGNGNERWPNGGRNVRSVWSIATEPYPDAHFATFPTDLARRCILAGCPEWVCSVCGKPRERIVERGELVGKDAGGNYAGRDIDPLVKRNGGTPGMQYENKTVGWSDCDCLLTEGSGVKARADEHPSPSVSKWRPGRVLDPFGGSGTTALVARNHGRGSVLIELNPVYADLAAKRLQQLSLLAEGAGL